MADQNLFCTHRIYDHMLSKVGNFDLSRPRHFQVCGFAHVGKVETPGVPRAPGAPQDAQGRAWPSQGGGRRPPPNGVPPRHAPSLQMWTKLDFLPSDAVRSRIAVFAAFSSPGHTSLSRHFPGDPPGDPWGLPLCHIWQKGRPLGSLSTSAP